MIDIKGHIIPEFPFDGINKVSDLIELDGPLLSHYKDTRGNDILFYWVDNNEECNRWLVWQVEEQDLLYYLCGSLPLAGLFPKNNKFIYVVDIDNAIKYKSVVHIYVTDLPENYKPEQTAYFKFELPEVYELKVKAISYIKDWELKGLYFNVEPSTNRLGPTVGIKDIWQVLQNVCKSFSEFVSYRVSNILAANKVDDKTITATAKSLSSASRLRLVYLNLNSFHAGIAAESIKIDSLDNTDLLQEFTTEVLKSFQKEVLDNDFASPKDIDSLVDKFDVESRKKIFTPILEIINNTEITLNITDYSKKFNKHYKRVPKSEKVRLIPEVKKIPDIAVLPEQVLVTGYYVADKVGDQISLFPKDKIMFGVRPVESFPIHIDSAAFNDGKLIKFNYSLETEVTFDDGVFQLSFPPLSILISSKKEADLVDIFNDEFIRLYNEYLKGDKIYSDFFEDIISKE